MGNKEKEAEIEELLKSKIHPDVIRKESKLQFDGKQYSIRIPITIIDELELKKGHPIIIEYKPETKEYSIKFKDK